MIELPLQHVRKLLVKSNDLQDPMVTLQVFFELEFWIFLRVSCCETEPGKGRLPDWRPADRLFKGSQLWPHVGISISFTNLQLSTSLLTQLCKNCTEANILINNYFCYLKYKNRQRESYLFICYTKLMNKLSNTLW